MENSKKTVLLVENSDSVLITRLLYNISISLAVLPEPYINKELVVTKREFKKSNKILAQSSLPIKKEVKPQFKDNYKPNTYLNKHHHARNY